MTAGLGHTQRLHANALDEAIALPTDFSARIARNTQIYIQNETKICKHIDPWAGSYYVESLTNELAHKAWEHIQEIEKLGGMAKAIETGVPKMRIEEAACICKKCGEIVDVPFYAKLNQINFDLGYNAALQEE